MRIDVDKKAGKTALVEALCRRRHRPRNHPKRHGVEKEKAFVKAKRKRVAALGDAQKSKKRSRYLRKIRAYWSGAVDDLS